MHRLLLILQSKTETIKLGAHIQLSGYLRIDSWEKYP